MRTHDIHINGRDDWHPDDYAATRTANGDVWGEYDTGSRPIPPGQAARDEARELLHKVIDTIVSETLPAWWGPMSYRAMGNMCGGDPALGKRQGRLLQAVYDATRKSVIETLGVEL